MSKNKIIWIIVLLIFVGFVSWLVVTPGKPGKLDTFASCLKDQGVKFYGAFWCPHCQAQKKLFGSSQKLLPYIECSTPDGNGQTQVCKDAKVESYPTWEFPKGERKTGEVSLKVLSELSSCPLPQQ